jgi:ribosomal protein S18 acetylase RimI-like enzyme
MVRARLLLGSAMPVRPATPEDVPGVLPMVRAICAMHERLDPERYAMLPDVVERYRRWLPERARDPRSVFLVAEDAGAPVGFLIGTVEASIPIYRLAEFGFIHDVWVDPARRGAGVGRTLVDEALARFRAMGITQVRLETAAANEGARRLFSSRGFRVGTVDMLRALEIPRPAP